MLLTVSAVLRPDALCKRGQQGFVLLS